MRWYRPLRKGLVLLMGFMRTATARRITLAAAGVAIGTIGIAAPLAGVAGAAPDRSELSPQQKARALDLIDQTPTVGITRSGILPTGGFVAPLAAAATGEDTTVVWLEPMPKDACATSLKDARVAVTWKNTSTGKTDDTTFAACTAGKPTLSDALETGAGTLKFTVTVLGKGGDTLTLSPGTATANR